jgi:hypothetical protein
MQMPALAEVITRIARCAKQQNFMNCTEVDKANAMKFKKDHKPLISEPPRLSIQQITEITRNYPFNLPTELLELYQIRNGCLPIGSDSDQDWNSLDNYFAFPDRYLARWLPLGEAMSYYPVSNYGCDPKLFPIIMGFERRNWGVIGSESNCSSSPIFFYFCDYPQHLKLAWSSLTSLLSAWVEIKEQQLDQEDDERIMKIASRYECGDKGLELLWYLSFQLY